MIELDDKSYIVSMWFSHNPVTNNDWMACVIGVNLFGMIFDIPLT